MNFCGFPAGLAIDLETFGKILIYPSDPARERGRFPMRVLQGKTSKTNRWKKRYGAEQIIRILGEIENSGQKVSDACRQHGISEQTYFR